MSRKIDRRAAMTALAGMVAVPSTIAIAATVDNPDREILELGLEYARLLRNSEDVSAQKARAEEITREWHRWRAECDALDERLGCDASWTAAEAITSDMSDIADKIAALPARTLEGLKVRAAVLKLIYSDEVDGRPDDTIDGRNVWAMIRDLEAMSGSPLLSN
jgi:hypothetical protein